MESSKQLRLIHDGVEPSDHYMLETTATLSGNGGYGILVETKSKDASYDYGYPFSLINHITNQ